MSDIISIVSSIIEPVAKEQQLKVISISLFNRGKNPTLQIMIDKLDHSGISVSDCEKFSNEISILFDVDDIIKDKYILEVSSTGIDRLLIDNDDYDYFSGYMVNIKLNEKFEDSIKFKGILKGVTNDNFISILSGDVLNEFPLEIIHSIRLDKDSLLNNNDG